MNSVKDDRPDNRLTSWKEIADYLEVSERTAQKWERQKGMPVRRLPGARGRVFAVVAELDEWRKTVSQKGGPRRTAAARFRTRATLAAVTAFALLGLAVVWYVAVHRTAVPVLFRLDFNSLAVMDIDGTILWRKVFSDPFDPEAYSPEALALERRVIIDDIDPFDAGPEILFTYLPVTQERTGAALICFSSSGEEKWSFVPGRRIRDRRTTYSSVYLISRLLVTTLEKGGEKRILVTSRHVYSHPNQFVALDGKGNVLGEYWHSGHLTSLDSDDFDGDGFKEIALGGRNEGYGAAVAVILDPRRISGASAQGPADPNQIEGFPEAREEAFILFPQPWTEAGRRSEGAVRFVRIEPDCLRVDVQALQSDPEAIVTYELDRDLNPTAIVSGGFLNLHRNLELRGELGHPFSPSELEELERIRILKRGIPIPGSGREAPGGDGRGAAAKRSRPESSGVREDALLPPASGGRIVFYKAEEIDQAGIQIFRAEINSAFPGRGRDVLLRA